MFISFSNFILNESKISNEGFRNTLRNFLNYFDKQLIKDLKNKYNTNIMYSMRAEIYDENNSLYTDTGGDKIFDDIETDEGFNNSYSIRIYSSFYMNDYKLYVSHNIDLSYNIVDIIFSKSPDNKHLHLLKK